MEREPGSEFEATVDAELVADFERAVIEPDEWTHRSFVRVAYVYIHRHGLEGSIGRMRRGLRGLDLAYGRDSNHPDAYHETITVAWLAAVAAALGLGGSALGSADFLTRHAYLLDPRWPLRNYSEKVLKSVEARKTYVPPDRDRLAG